jgi:peptidoglycan/xylan/chitin deacetylase (PgdA/CDA1 family)
MEVQPSRRDRSSRRRALLVAGAVGAVVAVIAVVLVVAARRDRHVVTTGPPASTTTASSAPTSAPSTSGVTTTASTASTAPTSTSSTTPPPTPPPPTVTSQPPPTTGTTQVPDSPAIVVRRGDPSRPLVALTFDAGSDVGYASDILDTLHANGIRATFGMTGRWAEEHPALVRRIADEGHQLLNHSYDHPSFTGQSTGTAPLSRAARLDQLARADAAIRAAAGVDTVPWFRPPYGDEDASVRADVALAGYRYEVMWTVDSLGWDGLDADAIVDRCLQRAENGAIYLFHVGSASADAAALQRIIDGLRAQGYGFGTVAEIL